MENLIDIFLAEAKDLCSQLEKELLSLEKDHHNQESISSVFRAMHTLKGSAGMFGFEAIDLLTHELETIYEEIRDGKRELTSEILSTTFRSVDHLHTLMADQSMLQDETRKAQRNLLLEINQHTLSTGSPTVVTTSPKNETIADEFTYYILFQPVPEILHNGTNTLFLIDDLLALGKGVALPFFKDLPALADLVPDQSYTGFEVVLATHNTEQELREVFMFVESECELTIDKIADGNVIDTNAFTALRNEQKNIEAKGLEKIKQLLLPRTEISRAKVLSETVKVAKASASIRVASDKLDELMNLVSELVTTQAQLSLLASESESSILTMVAENVEKITRRLRDNAFTMSLIPLESLVVKFQRLVRDLSQELAKDIVFKAEGTDTEIDKSIIEKLSDPLLHLLRNSLDHGIETPEERVRKGKPSQGTVLLKSYYAGAHVVIEISDDGAGINFEKVRNKAISKGMISQDTALTEHEILDLIFLPGFSTAKKVTGVSGRGVGMDVVKRNIADLRGEVTVSSREGKGTLFTIKLPLTLSIIDGLLVEIDSTRFILPLISVNKCFEVQTSTLSEAFNQWVTLDGKRTPFLFLRKEFNIEKNPPVQSQLINIGHDGNFVSLAVDRIVGQYQAVLKPLGPQYRQQDEFSGATVLGDGSVALVLDTNRLIRKLIAQQEEEKNKVKVSGGLLGKQNP